MPEDRMKTTRADRLLDSAIREFGAKATKTSGTLKASGSPSTDEAGRGCAACIAGWKYDANGDAYRCEECTKATALAKLTEQVKASGIGGRYLETEWDNLTMVDPLPRLKRASENITAVIDAGESLLLHGDVGTGKTQAAALLVKHAIMAGRTARMVNLGRLGINVRAGYDGDGPSEKGVVELLSDVGLLVLDDVGAGETKNAAIEQRLLYLITEARQNAILPTVVTTNLSPRALLETVGKRIINRLQPLTSIAFTHGRNFRKRDGSQGGIW